MFIPVNRYCESALNAASQIHRLSSSINSLQTVKSDVRQIFAVPSPAVVTNKLKIRKKNSLIELKAINKMDYFESGLNLHLSAYRLCASIFCFGCKILK